MEKTFFVQAGTHPSNGSLDNVENIVSKISNVSGKYPQKNALLFNEHAINYSQLEKTSDALSKMLYELGISAGKVVAVAMCQSPERIIAMLSVLKAGGCYLPVESSLPVARIQNMLEDSDTKVLITDDADRFKKEFPDLDIIDFNESNAGHFLLPDTSLAAVAIDKNQPAYIIYTSGSTGVPKGVVIHHEALSQFLESFTRLWQFSSEDNFLQFGSPAFDVSIIDIWIPLSIGATVHLYPDNKIIGQPILDFVVKNEITVIPSLTPTVMSTLPTNHYIGKLKKVILVGEAPSERVVRDWKNKVTLINGYGPTETTVIVASHLFRENDSPTIIGKSIPGTDIFILDDELKSVETGVEGELYIGGKQLSKGYLNRPDDTQKVFIDAPSWIKEIKEENYKLYKTGDRGVLRGDQTIEFIGRYDDQVKLRGYRIELKEIEHHIRQLGNFSDVSVTVYRSKNRMPMLIAFVEVSADNSDGVLQMKNKLRNIVPVYMLPDKIFTVDKLPLTITGKVDKKELESRLEDLLSRAPVAQKTNNLEEEVIEIWKDLLGLDNVGTKSNFFDLGGHSLMVAQLYGRLPQEVKLRMSLPEIYNYPTIESFIQEITKREQQERVNINTRAKAVEKQLTADATLPEGFEVNCTPDLAAYANPANIFLTGVTGFVGSQLLVELIKRNPAAMIHCLVRAENPELALERIKSTFIKFRIPWESVYEKNISIILGDIEDRFLGMSTEQYMKISQLIDVVYHMASNVSYIQPYEMIKKPNVEGTQNILLFSTQSKLKLLIVSSSTGVYSWGRALTGKTWMTEDDPIEQNLPAVSRDMGYIRSKWVMDNIISQARAKGLPIMNFRLGFVVCHSQTGATPLNQWWSSMMRSCIELNSFPLVMALKDELVTVDYVCEAIAHIGRNTDAIGLNFNLSPAAEHDLSLTDFCVKIAEYCDIEMKGLEFHEWFKQWDGNEELPIHSLLYLFNEEVYEGKTLVEAYENTYYVKSTNTVRFLKGSTIQQPVFTRDVIRSYVRFMKMGKE
ncbi:amino acid adenylation domain-containing protein [Gynurincola endophyticus]|uniref:amino acid adenylation domain-containing protein n=1 Tax=Gynurincola endophyticus TaxID=2479004 RepID=UPI001315A405|nr:amino acid adenylation domain-containing protein [Gynurincola endophyticus]